MGFADDIVARARGDLNRAERDATSARERLQRAEAEISDLQAFLRKLEHYAAPVQPSTLERIGARASERLRIHAGGKSKELVDVAIEIIRDANTRVPIVELFEGILGRGLKIGGKDEKSNLAGYLSRDKRVDYERGVGWGVVGEGTASTPGSQEAAPSTTEGGSDDRPTLAAPDDITDLLG